MMFVRARSCSHPWAMRVKVWESQASGSTPCISTVTAALLR
ncbi:hypothetical protein [Mesorhizobium sp.]|nr:hypothetical protein [Mesorhizobium sp.]